MIIPMTSVPGSRPQNIGALLAAILCSLSCLRLLPATLAQSSATSISFQGALKGANGQALPDGPHTLVFRFYDAEQGGSSIGSPITKNNVQVTGGIASTPVEVAPATFNGQTSYLGISVDGGQELTPRLLITAVPYAITSQTLGSELLISPGIKLSPLGGKPAVDPWLEIAFPSR